MVLQIVVVISVGRVRLQDIAKLLMAGAMPKVITTGSPIITDKATITAKVLIVFRPGVVRVLITALKMTGVGPGGLTLAVTQPIFKQSAHRPTPTHP